MASAENQASEAMTMRRFVVRRAADGRWTFGREETAFEIFDSKEAAVRTAERFAQEHPDAELVIEDAAAPRKRQACGVGRGRLG
jgi:hypothetical protein